MCRRKQYCVQAARKPEIMKKNNNQVENREMSVEIQTYRTSSSSIILQWRKPEEGIQIFVEWSFINLLEELNDVGKLDYSHLTLLT